MPKPKGTDIGSPKKRISPPLVLIDENIYTKIDPIKDDDLETFAINYMKLPPSFMQKVMQDTNEIETQRESVVTRWLETIDETTLKKDKLQDLVETFNRKRASTLKGKVLVLINTFAEHPGYNRLEAAKRDKAMMRELWETILGCECEIKMNRTGEEMKEDLKNFANQAVDSYDYVAVVISTHGDLMGGRECECEGETCMEGLEEVFLGNDKVSVKVQDQLELFNNENAKNLQGVKKLFLFDFCRGSKVDRGAQKKPVSYPLRVSPNIILPQSSDILVAHSSHLGYVSYDDDGSYFLKKVKEIFCKHAHEEDVVSMLTMVNKEMRDGNVTENKEENEEAEKEKNEGGKVLKAMSKFESSLTEKFYLRREQVNA